MQNLANDVFGGVRDLTLWAVNPSNTTAPTTPSNIRKGISEVISEGSYLVMLVGFISGVIHNFLAPSIHKQLTTHKDTTHHNNLLAIFGNNPDFVVVLSDAWFNLIGAN